MSNVLVAAPLALEQVLIRSGTRGARVRKTGMGPHKSLAAAERLRVEPGDALMVLGFCGGLDAQSRPGEVIVAESVCAARDEGQTVPERVACADAEGLARRLREQAMTVRSGEIVCVAKLALDERRAQLLAGGALAVDMESVWLAPGAAGRPFAVVRVVLDSPSHELMRPRAAAGAVRAARVLRRVAGVLHDWEPPSHAQGPAVSAEPRNDDAGSAGLHGGPQGV